MIKYALPVAVLYFGVVSTAVALPGSILPQLTSPNDIVQVGSKGKGKGHVRATARAMGKAIRGSPAFSTRLLIKGSWVRIPSGSPISQSAALTVKVAL